MITLERIASCSNQRCFPSHSSYATIESQMVRNRALMIRVSACGAVADGDRHREQRLANRIESVRCLWLELCEFIDDARIEQPFKDIASADQFSYRKAMYCESNFKAGRC